MTKIMPDEKFDVRSVVRERYGAIAEKTRDGSPADCCESSSQSSCCGPQEMDEAQLSAVSKMYEDPDVNDLPVRSD